MSAVLTRSLLCATIASVAVAQTPLYPGTPRAFRIADATLSPTSFARIAVGDFSGDHRCDAAVVANDALHLVLGVYGFGRPLAVSTPGGGSVTDGVCLPGGAPSGDAVLFAVSDGAAPGLHLASVDASGELVVTDCDVRDFAGARELRFVAHGGATRLFALVPDGDAIVVAEVSGSRVVTVGSIGLAGPASALRVAPWRNDADLCLFVKREQSIDVLALDGSEIESIGSLAPIFDFDAAWSRALARGRVAIVTADETGASGFELHDPDGVTAQVATLGVAKPRFVFDDLFARGELDVCAVNSHGPSGFAVFGGLGATPDTFAFTLQGGVIFEFPSPAFGLNSKFANVAIADVDGDGDRDAVFADPLASSIWAQPSWALDELQAAPRAIDAIPVFTRPNPGWQWFQFAFTPPAGLPASHVEVTVYQQSIVAGVPRYALVASEVETVSTSEIDPSKVLTGTVAVFGEYEGPEATDADFVCALRILVPDAPRTQWVAFGAEGFAGFHHTRTPDPSNPGGFMDGTPGGTNPLPTVIGSGITGVGQTPPPPPPPGG